MVTLRTYTNSIEAGMAKSILDEHNIFCSLADENANVYGGAPFAMPVRLQVREEQADEALRILETTAQTFSENFGQVENPPEKDSMSSRLADILDELKKLRGRIENNTALVVLLFVGLVFYALIQVNLSTRSSGSPSRQTDSWNLAHAAMDKFDYDKAADIVQRLIQKNPNYYYGYSFLGHIALARNRLKEAEGYFARSYELFPTDENEQKLQAVRKRLAAENPEVKR
ncbi:MAG TPA: DUF2007 domain-containing protein [Chthoniobacterales bacterium]|nr:DUF2007 domain-containing protein [Chthoniobacterales bacterium]